jgi:hypothetical protein
VKKKVAATRTIAAAETETKTSAVDFAPAGCLNSGDRDTGFATDLKGSGAVAACGWEGWGSGEAVRGWLSGEMPFGGVLGETLLGETVSRGTFSGGIALGGVCPGETGLEEILLGETGTAGIVLGDAGNGDAGLAGTATVTERAPLGRGT